MSPVDDCFRTECFPVIVAARPLSGVTASPPEVDIFFGSRKDIQIDPQKKFIMVEAKSGYFEASRHILRAIQKLSTEIFPLSDSICKLTTKIPPPSYLEKNPERSLSAAYINRTGDSQAKRANVLSQWPELTEQSALDQSQWDALQSILTKSLAIVQGPPGTGKTHVSIIALKILVENMSFDSPPIIVAAHTNHALDQLLRHVSVFLGEDYIRLGGRTKDPEIKKQSIFEVRKKVKVQGSSSSPLTWAQRNLKNLTHRMVNTISSMIREDQQRPFSPATLEEFQVISHDQRTSLEAGAAQWTIADEQSEIADPTSLWLSKALRTFEVVYKQPNFGFEEEEIDDLEYEQLKDLEAEQGADEDESENLHGIHRRIADRFTANGSLSTASRRDAENLLRETPNLWKISASARGTVYLLMQEKAKAKMQELFLEQAKEYEKLVENLKVGKWERDASILSKAKIIGMTTTGLSKYRPLVASLEPKVVLIEEAAECIEAPVTAACFNSLEHLILIGDHQQLQGSCAVQELSGDPYHLEVSMFERLVVNRVPYNTLVRQRRMDPEIRRLLQPIYGDKLQDHPSVHGRPTVPGMGSVRSFLFGHRWPESTDSSSSKYNENEADFIAGFFTYLTHNGIPATGITVLTFYNGQRKRILKNLKRNPNFAGEYLKVATVDSYQGEENAVVLLSLVRSNSYRDDRSIGFLAIANRVCVALSRAELGFYMFGNESQLIRASPLWSDIIGVMKRSPNRVGYKLPLECTNHGRPFSVTNSQEWDTIFGGCDLRCQHILHCGHSCPIRCHPFSHNIVLCKERCIRKLPCGDICERLCSEQPCYCKCEDFVRFVGEDSSLSASREFSKVRGPQSMAESWLNNIQSSNEIERNVANLGGMPKSAADRPNSPTHHRGDAGEGTETNGMRFDGGGSTRPNSDDKSSGQSYHSHKHQVTSRALWKEFADGKVREDDLKRDMDHKKALGAETAAIEEQLPNMLIDLGSGAGILSETVENLPSNRGPPRARYDQTFVLGIHGFEKPQEWKSEAAPVAEVSLLD